MVALLAHLIVSAALLVLVAELVRGIELEGVGAALLAAAVLGIVNALVRPPAFLLSLPLIVVTFGLFYFVLNAAFLKLTAAVVPGFRIEGFLPAVWAAVLLAILNVVIARIAGPGWGV